MVLGKAMTMFASEPTLTTDDLEGITAPTLVLSGDDDGVRLDHTCAMFLALPAGQLAVVPGSSHAVPIEKPADVARLVVDFLSSGPPETFMPILRAPRRRADRCRPGSSALRFSSHRGPTGRVGRVADQRRTPDRPIELPAQGVVVMAPNRPWVSLAGPALNSSVFVSAVVPFPNISAQRPSIWTAWPLRFRRVPRNLPVVAL